jgi:TIR domain
MIRLEVNGRPFNPQSFQEQLMKGAMESLGEHLHSRISSIRDPDTGEFPTVLVTATGMADISAQVEGSPALLAIVKQRLNNQAAVPFQELEKPVDVPKTPVVFLSYAWEDSDLAGRIARSLQANGIDTWWAGWSMKAGDSLPQKINEGLAGCTHFVVLLTPASMQKPWVKQEMDAGLVRKIADQCVFIALRNGVPARELPPLLAAHLSPEIADPEVDLTQLINDIHGINRKPPLGKPPVAVIQHPAQARHSAAATAVARVFVEQTKHGLWADPQLTAGDLSRATGLTGDDIADALHELWTLVEDHHGRILPKAELFAQFDSLFKDWDPSEDALRLATDIVNDAEFPADPAMVATHYGWPPRRLNPAIAYLESRKLIDCRHTISPAPFVAYRIGWTAATRRFVKSRLS